MAWPFWSGYLLRLAIAAVVLASLYAIARTLRAMRLQRAGRRCVEVVETTVLAPQAAVHLLRVGQRYLLVGSGPGRIAPIAEIEAGDIAQQPATR